MIRQNIEICNHTGLHLRPAGQLCKKALEYRCKIEMVMDEKTFNLKSVLSVLSAQIASPREVELVCDGSDEELAMTELTEFLKTNLDEIPE